MKKEHSLFSASILHLLIITFFYSTTTSAQLSPVQAPLSSTPAPGFNTVPLVPVSPSGAPIPNIIPKSPSIDIIQILKKAKRFTVLTRLLKTTQLINQLNSQLVTSSSSSSSSSDSGGLTVFAPEDGAFSKLKPGFLNSLNDRHKVELLQFHTLSSFISISNFDTLTNPVQTQAGDDAKRLQLNVTTSGGSHVSMTTGAVNASVTGTVYADNKLAIYQVDKVLVPLDLVLPAKAPALAPAPVSKGDSSKPDDRSKSSSSKDDDDDENKDLPAEASGAGYSNVYGMWLSLVFGMVLLGGEAML